MELADLLVSYKQVRVPKEREEVIAPPTRYDNMVHYIEQRDEASKEGKQKEFKWRYMTDTPRQYNINDNPIMSKNEWTNQLIQAYRKLRISENGIRNLVAKNALESGWGQHAQGRFNYGNITTGSSWTGDYVNGRDHDAKGNPIQNKFRSYNSLEEFAADEVAFLSRLYDFNDNDDIDTFLSKLQGGNKGGRNYASDPKYKDKVKKIYNNLG